MSASENRCEQMQDLLSEYVDGRLGTADAARVAAHVAACPECASFLGFLKATSFVMTNRTLDVRPPAALFDRVAQMTYARPTWQQRFAQFLNPASTRLALGTALAVGVFAVAVLPRLQADKHTDATGTDAHGSLAQTGNSHSGNAMKPLVAANSMATRQSVTTPTPVAAPNTAAPKAHTQVADVVAPSHETKASSDHAPAIGVARNAAAHAAHPLISHTALAVTAPVLVKLAAGQPARTAPLAPAATPHLAVVVRHSSDAHLSESLSETMAEIRREHTDRILAMQPSREMRPDDRKMAVNSGVMTQPLMTHDVSPATENALKVPAAISNSSATGISPLPRRHFTLAGTGTGHSSIGSLLNNLKVSHGTASQNGLPQQSKICSIVGAPTGNAGSSDSAASQTIPAPAAESVQTADTQ